MNKLQKYILIKKIIKIQYNYFFNFFVNNIKIWGTNDCCKRNFKSHTLLMYYRKLRRKKK